MKFGNFEAFEKFTQPEMTVAKAATIRGMYIRELVIGLDGQSSGKRPLSLLKVWRICMDSQVS
jgi:hypothetical protein